MKKVQPNTILNAFLLALALALAPNAASHAQTTFTTAQLANLQPLDPSAVPPFGTFWLLKSPYPDHGYPPLPCPPGDLPGLPIYDLGGGHFLVDDSQVDYDALRQQQEADRALSSLEVQYGLRTSPDGGGVSGPMGLDSYTADDLWLEIISVTNGLANFTIHTPDTAAYDLFGTTNLSANVPGLNLTNWVWLLRTDVGQTNNIILTNLWPDMGFFRLGTMLDSDGDGLTDAYEKLVSHTDPTKWDTDGDGLSDGWEVAHGMNPNLDENAQTSGRLNYTYDGAGWLGTVSGAQNGTVTLDAEGNVQQVSQ
jgi:hypothetical protein